MIPKNPIPPVPRADGQGMRFFWLDQDMTSRTGFWLQEVDVVVTPGGAFVGTRTISQEPCGWPPPETDEDVKGVSIPPALVAQVTDVMSGRTPAPAPDNTDFKITVSPDDVGIRVYHAIPGCPEPEMDLDFGADFTDIQERISAHRREVHSPSSSSTVNTTSEYEDVKAEVERLEAKLAWMVKQREEFYKMVRNDLTPPDPTR